MLKRMRKRFERWGAMLVFCIVNNLSRRQALGLADFLAGVAFHVMLRFRQIALDNVNTAYGDTISVKEKCEIVRLSFKNLSRTLVDFLRFRKYSHDDFLNLVKRIEGLEYLEKAMNESPGGVIGLAAHIGGWEFGGAYLVALGYPVVAIGRDQPDQVLTELMYNLRKSAGIEPIPRGKHGNRAVIETLNQKKVLGLLADQNGGKKGIFVPFFGKMASSFRGPAQIALKKKVPVLLIVALWEGDYYFIKISPPLELANTGNIENDIYENTARFQKKIEDMVREYPEQWFWNHRRWKTRPPDEIA